MRYSDDNDVNDSVNRIIESMGHCPFDPPSGTWMTLADVIESIRKEHGPRAARSVRITLH